MCFASIVNSSQAQVNELVLDKKVDSIEKINGDDIQKINLLWQTAWDYNATNFEKAKKILFEAEVLAQKINYHKGLIEIYNKTGAVYQKAGEYDSAIFFHLKCLRLREKSSEYTGIARTYGNLGLAYIQLKDSSKAINYLMKSLQADINDNNRTEQAGDYINIGTFYLYLNIPKVARLWFFKALPLLFGKNEVENLAMVYNNIGICYFYENSYKKALENYFRSVQIFEKLGNGNKLAEAYNNIGTIFYKNVNIDSAYFYFQKALVIAIKNKATTTVRDIYENLTSYYDSLKDYKNAFIYNVLHEKMNDSIYTIEKSKAISELQTKYDSEKDKERISTLTAERKFQGLLRNSLIVIAIMAFFIVIVLINRYRKQKRLMNIISEEKGKSDALLLNILPYETAEELKKYGKTKAHDYDEVSVLFTDIISFTAISEKMSAADIVADLDMYFGAFDDIITSYGMEKIKTIGDAYLAAGGLPNPENGTPKEVIMAALEMQQYMLHVKEERSAKGLPFFEIRLGIHTGPVVAGVVGNKKFQYDIWGDTVNTASRIQTDCDPGKINISATTYQRVKDDFVFTFRGPRHVKNKEDLIDMYYVEGVK